MTEVRPYTHESGHGVEQSKNDDGINVSQVERSEPGTTPIIRLDSYRDDRHINLTWRSWMVVLYVTNILKKKNPLSVYFANCVPCSVTCFA